MITMGVRILIFLTYIIKYLTGDRKAEMSTYVTDININWKIDERNVYQELMFFPDELVILWHIWTEYLYFVTLGIYE